MTDGSFVYNKSKIDTLVTTFNFFNSYSLANITKDLLILIADNGGKRQIATVVVPQHQIAIWRRFVTSEEVVLFVPCADDGRAQFKYYPSSQEIKYIGGLNISSSVLQFLYFTN